MLFLLLFAADVAVANDGIYHTTGNFLVPVRPTTISVKKELLAIKICDDGFADVNVDYIMQNDGSQQTLTMAFEAEPGYPGEPLRRTGGHPQIQSFKVTMNGAALPYRNGVIAINDAYGAHLPDFTPLDLSQWKGCEEVADSVLPTCDALYNARLDSTIDYAYAYYFDATFVPGENRVHHHYRFRMGQSVLSRYDITYWLTPATRWANGQIDDFTLLVLTEGADDIVMEDSMFLQEPFILKELATRKTIFRTDDKAHQAENICLVQLRGENGRPYLYADISCYSMLEWHCKNFRPTENLHITDFSAIEPCREGATEAKVVVAPEGTGADRDMIDYRYIADAGDYYFIAASDYGLVPKAGARVETRRAEDGQGYVCLNYDVKRGNVRQSPSLKSKVVCTLKNEYDIPDAYPCLGYVSVKTEPDGLYKQWYKINVDGKVGYISADISTWDFCMP